MAMTYEDVVQSRFLMAAVIMQAVRDLGRPGEQLYGEEAALRERARGWLFSDGLEPGSFRFFCMALDWDSEWIRARVRGGRYDLSKGMFELEEPRLDQLKRLIQKRGLSVAGLARELGMHSETLSGLIHRRRRRSKFVPRMIRYLDGFGGDDPVEVCS